MGYSGLYEGIKTGTNEGSVNIVIGGSILTASYIGAAVLNRFSNYKK